MLVDIYSYTYIYIYIYYCMHIFIHLIPLHEPLCGKEYAKHDCHFNLFWLKKVLGRYKHIKLPTQHHHWQHTKPKCLHPRAALPRLVYLWCGVLHAIVLFRSLEGTRRTWAFWSAAILGPGPSLSGMLLGDGGVLCPPKWHHDTRSVQKGKSNIGNRCENQICTTAQDQGENIRPPKLLLLFSLGLLVCSPLLLRLCSFVWFIGSDPLFPSVNKIVPFAFCSSALLCSVHLC